MPERDVLARVHDRVAQALEDLEPLFPTHRLTFLARCTREDLADADVLVSSDDLEEIAAAIEKRVYAEQLEIAAEEVSSCLTCGAASDLGDYCCHACWQQRPRTAVERSTAPLTDGGDRG